MLPTMSSSYQMGTVVCLSFDRVGAAIIWRAASSA
jgi:hypothetical protein